MFSKMMTLMKGAPGMQFGIKSLEETPRLFSDIASPTAVSSGMGQGLSPNVDRQHAENVRKNTLAFNRMKFEIMQRSTL